jgi:hypothetical protein
LNFTVNFVPPASALWATFVLFHVFDAEAQKYGLFRPLVHMPAAIIGLFSDTQFAAIQSSQCALNGIAGFASGGRCDGITCIPCSFNGGLELGV